MKASRVGFARSPMKIAVALAPAFGVLGIVAAGCGTKSDHPPQLSSSPAGTTPDFPVECAELFAASDELRPQVPGPLVYDGGAAACIVKGAECPLRDSDAGICDGGHAAALPGARCLGGQWLSACFGQDAGPDASPDAATDAGDGGMP